MRFRNSTQKRKNGKRTLCLLAVLFILFQTGAAAKAVSQTPQDSTTFHGNDLGENELRVSGGTSEENPYAFVLCQKLNVYTQKDTDSEVAGVLEYGSDHEVLEENEEMVFIRFYQIVNGTPFERYGWVSKEYVVLDPPYYIANHPSPVLATPQDDAKILCWLNTYDALRVIGEAEDFYIVSLHGAAGFMKKE